MSDRRFRQGFWRLADPKISLASFAGLFTGACFAAADGVLHLGWLVLTVLGIFFVEVAKNASGELVDFDSGTDLAVAEEDRSPFSGGKRVLVEGLLTRTQCRNIAALFFAAAILVGLVIVFFRDSRVLLFGLPGIALAWYYHGGRLRLAYRGFGELAVALAYGPLVTCGTYFVQTGVLSTVLIHISIVLGLLVAAFLWINEFPDYAADRAAGKRNLVVRLGKENAVAGYVALMVAAYSWLAFTALHFVEARGVLLGFAGALPGAYSIRQLLRAGGVTLKIVPAQAACLIGFLLMALGCSLGYLLCCTG